MNELTKIVEFYEAGGRVIFTTQLPAKSTEPGQDGQIANLMNRLFPKGTSRDTHTVQTASNGGQVWFLPDPSKEMLQKALTEKATKAYDIEFPEETAPLRYIHKEHDGRDLFYLANLNGKPFESTVVIRGKKEFSLWDPHNGEVLPIETKYTRKGRERVTLIDLTLAPSQSVFLIEAR